MPAEERPFKNYTIRKVLEVALYTGEEMFGDIIFDAMEELRYRITPPDWASKEDKEKYTKK